MEPAFGTDGVDEFGEFGAQDLEIGGSVQGVAQEDTLARLVVRDEFQNATARIVGDQGKERSARTFHPDVTEVEVRNQQDGGLGKPRGASRIDQQAGSDRQGGSMSRHGSENP
jgi:hypothetical protein